jgi:hypothetical protein
MVSGNYAVIAENAVPRNEFGIVLMEGERAFVRVPLFPQAGTKDPNT